LSGEWSRCGSDGPEQQHNQNEPILLTMSFCYIQIRANIPHKKKGMKNYNGSMGHRTAEEILSVYVYVDSLLKFRDGT
jgi:hypothetical protein